ncbi:hypothetical protein [Clostridium cellulovorans]|uniref:H+-ATPase subunit H n=1 Tax=Clostridium cellulovorans (strain ATCC 35296 / DSM 3052 / OCM 3 / 743B) TaxID=573061 RepID=D9SLB6_CLOC7|nr:hypothetical protein [Clostridium cellulovorans]ADL51632.1 H+-ATPase subunit H [Clostridium cellulovorans 743B]
MEFIELVELLREIADTAPKVPLGSKVMIDKKELIKTLDEIENTMPEEFRRAQWIVEEKQRILDDAIKQADSYKRENMEVLREKIENHDIVVEAKERAEEIRAAAEADAQILRAGARDYAEEVLKNIDEEIQKRKMELLNGINERVASTIGSIDDHFNNTSTTLRENLKELKKVVPQE